jgi:hypothetical protein
MSEDLAEWFTQIWDEEERLAKRAGDTLTTPEIDNYGHLTVPSGWMLARIAADRQILALHAGHPVNLDNEIRCTECTSDQLHYPCRTVRLLASVYAERPGYREEWRP